MSFEAWATFCLTELVLCLTPGPAVLLVVSITLGRGLRPGLGASAGILAANAFYFALSATGVAAALVASRELFLLMKWVGAAYLVWVGIRMLMGRGSAGQRARPLPVRRSFVRGLVVQGANPKALIFFMALLPQFVDASAPLAPQVVVLGVSSVLIELLVLAVYAHGAIGAHRVAGARVARLLERVGGGLLVAAGARLAAARHE